MVSKDSNFVNLAVDSRSISVYWGMLNFVIHSILISTLMSVDCKLKILIVEDDEFLSGMYVTKFTLEGFVVNFAGDGEEGLRKAREVQPHLILLDVPFSRERYQEGARAWRGRLSGQSVQYSF